MSSIDDCQVLSAWQESGEECLLSTTTMMMASNVANRILINSIKSAAARSTFPAEG
jgi:hypothetical protein